MIKPAESCLGFSLLVGVEAVCLVVLVVAVLFIAVCSSTEPLQIGGLEISPTVQVFAASWAFVGIPLDVAAGVAALHRIEQALRLFFFYMLATLGILLVMVLVWFIFANSLCDLAVHPDLQSQGTAFVCGFANTFVFVWALILFMSLGYTVFVIWSAAEEVRKNPHPELRRFEEHLSSVRLPAVGDELASPSPQMMEKAARGVASSRAPRGQISADLRAAEARGQSIHFGAGGSCEEGMLLQRSFSPAPARGAAGVSYASSVATRPGV